MLQAAFEDVPRFFKQIAHGFGAQGTCPNGSVGTDGDGCAGTDKGTNANAQRRFGRVFPHARRDGDGRGEGEAHREADRRGGLARGAHLECGGHELVERAGSGASRGEAAERETAGAEGERELGDANGFLMILACDHHAGDDLESRSGGDRDRAGDGLEGALASERIVEWCRAGEERWLDGTYTQLHERMRERLIEVGPVGDDGHTRTSAAKSLDDGQQILAKEGLAAAELHVATAGCLHEVCERAGKDGRGQLVARGGIAAGEVGDIAEGATPMAAAGELEGDGANAHEQGG